MPLPKDMGKCMSKFKKEHPKGRGKMKNKGNIQKQRVAACLSVKEGAIPTFKDFILMEKGFVGKGSFKGKGGNAPQLSQVQQFIKTLDSYAELKQNENTRSQAFQMAKQLTQQYGDAPLDDAMRADIEDAFNDLVHEYNPHGAMMGDWEGERERQERINVDKAMDAMADDFEKATGQNAETGEDLPEPRGTLSLKKRKPYPKRRMLRGATHQVPKIDRARDELAAIDAGDDPEDVKHRPRKITLAKQIFHEFYGKVKPIDIKKMFMKELGMSMHGATTYYYKIKGATGKSKTPVKESRMEQVYGLLRRGYKI